MVSAFSGTCRVGPSKRRAGERSGPRFAGYVVGDRKYATAPFLHTAGEVGLPVVARLKENLPLLAVAVRARFDGQPPPTVFPEDAGRVEVWDYVHFDSWETLDWPEVRCRPTVPKEPRLPPRPRFTPLRQFLSHGISETAGRDGSFLTGVSHAAILILVLGEESVEEDGLGRLRISIVTLGWRKQAAEPQADGGCPVPGRGCRRGFLSDGGGRQADLLFPRDCCTSWRRTKRTCPRCDTGGKAFAL